MKKIIQLLIFFLLGFNVSAQTFTTTFEKSKGTETTTYFECIDFYSRLAKKYPQFIALKTFGNTDAGYPLHLIIFNSGKKLQPSQWKNELRIMVNNGIHPGEPDGIDASMMLIRDAAEGKIKVPGNVVLAVIPVYNIGGSLNRNSTTRVNQEGPVSYGFRGNAQNLDLNRDFIKSDSRNARTFAEIFQFMDPDIFVDNHVSDGADYQHTMTLLTTQHSKLGGEIGTFLHDTFEPALYKSMATKNWPLIPYVNFYSADPEKGWPAFMDPPRYSSGYAALFQTIAFVPETHMLKPYKERVTSTYDLMQTIIDEGSKYAADIKAKRKASIDAMIEQKEYPLEWKLDSSRIDYRTFLGYTSGKKKSDVTGMDRLFYDRTKPYSKQVEFYNYFTGERIVSKPKAYIIPQGWHEVIDLLKVNKVAMQRLAKDSTIEVEAYRIEDYQTRNRAYESHYSHSATKVSSSKQRIPFLKGDYVVYTGQRADRFLVETLEPTGDDGYFAWNYFDAILQQKEGYSDYRWEDVAAKYLEQHPELREKLEAKKKADEKFAVSSSAQLEFVYKSSPYYEPAHLRYPVYRLVAKSYDMPKSTGWVNDLENILSPSEEKTLTDIIEAFEKKTSIEIVIVTIDSSITTRDAFDSYILALHNNWGVGKKEKNNGIVIGVSKQMRKIRISNGDGIASIMTDEETKEIVYTRFIPSFKADNFFIGLETGLNALIGKLNEKSR